MARDPDVAELAAKVRAVTGDAFRLTQSIKGLLDDLREFTDEVVERRARPAYGGAEQRQP